KEFHAHPPRFRRAFCHDHVDVRRARPFGRRASSFPTSSFPTSLAHASRPPHRSVRARRRRRRDRARRRHSALRGVGSGGGRREPRRRRRRAQVAAGSDPDGYTLYITSVPHATNRFLYPSLNYDPIADFAPVTLICTQSNIMVVPNSSPAKSVREFVAYAKANAGRISYGSGLI